MMAGRIHLEGYRAVLHGIKKMSDPGASLVLLLLLSVDVVLSSIHILFEVFDENPAFCKILGICTFMEAYHLIKMFWIIILFVYMLRKTRYFGYVTWILMFICFLIDDALWLHQKLGDWIAMYPVGYGLPSRFYELAVLALAGLLLLASVAWSYFQGPVTFRKISIDMCLFLVALVLFGLVVDIANVMRLGHRVIAGLGFVEDSGELVVYSLIVWYVFMSATRGKEPDLYLADILFHRRSP